jgi:N6-L-threonylcarbamoyladenine synthase
VGTLVLGLETSCDETAASVVEDGRRVLSDVVASQVAVHAVTGGVVPEVASRQHLGAVLPVVRQALAAAGLSPRDLGGIAVTNGPGLVGPLLVGVEVGKSLAYAIGCPIVGVNHLAGHLAAIQLDAEGGVQAGADGPPYPHVALLVSGGHTLLVRRSAPLVSRVLGATRDDAAGEAFDKVAKLLGLGYPGGVEIDRRAAQGDPRAVRLPRPLPQREELDFSFSGLKTAVANHVRDGRPEGAALDDLCASFQAAVVDVLARKARRAVSREGVAHLLVCGGVAANRGLRAGLAAAAQEDGFSLWVPPAQLCTDNGAMIAAAGSVKLAAGARAGLELGVDPGLPLT